MSIADGVFSSHEEARQAGMAESRDRATYSQIAATVINEFGYDSTDEQLRQLFRLMILVNEGRENQARGGRINNHLPDSERDLEKQINTLKNAKLRGRGGSVPDPEAAARLSKVNAMYASYQGRMQRLKQIEQKTPAVATASYLIRANLVSNKPDYEVKPDGTVGLKGALPANPTPASTAAQNAQSGNIAGLTTAIASQANNARGAGGATPVAPPKPPKKAPKKTLPKPKGRKK